MIHYNNTDESQKDYAEWMKSVSGVYILYDSVYIKVLEKNKLVMENISSIARI